MKLYTKTSGSGKDVVLLHGWGLNASVWDAVANELKGKYRVTQVDLPGFGKSHFYDKAYSLNELVDNLFHHIPSPCTLIGWSLGGLISLAACLQHPNKVQKLITITSTPKFVACDDWPGVDIATLTNLRSAVQTDGSHALKRFVTLLSKDSLNKTKTQALLALSHNPLPQQAALLAGLDLLANTDFRDCFSQPTCPCLHIFGDKDPLIPNAAVTALKQNNTDMIEIIPGAGHVPFLSHPAAFMHKISQAIH